MRLMQHLLLLKSGEEIARFVPSETVIMATRDRYYSSIRQCKTLGSLNPILEYLAECFAISAENVIQDSKKLVKQSLDRKPEARREKIITLSRQKKEFGIQDVVNVLPEVPLRTLRRDLDSLVTENKLKAKGANKNRTYFR
jgi:Fic family protein